MRQRKAQFSDPFMSIIILVNDAELIPSTIWLNRRSTLPNWLKTPDHGCIETIVRLFNEAVHRYPPTDDTTPSYWHTLNR
jgi:hypothetical protein